MSRRYGLLLATFVFLVAACQPVAEAPTTEPIPAPIPTGATAEPSGSDPGATVDPAWVTRPALTCGDPERLFPPESLAGLGLAELGLDPAAGILRATTAEAPAESQFPDGGWYRVIDDPADVTFVAPGSIDIPWVTVTVGLLNGTLQATESGLCNLAIAAPDGVNFGRWWLDPAGPPLTPESTTIAILIREVECASGQPPEGRVLPPTIIATAGAFQIAVGIREQPTAQECPSNPAYSIEVVLPEPLGSRGLFDASASPPRPVTTQDPG